jgi:hypothetical protein
MRCAYMSLIDTQIIKFLDTFRDFVYHDIESAISGNANYLAALGLSVYTEQLGGLYNGNFVRLAQNYADFISAYFDASYQQQESNSIDYIKNHPNDFPRLVRQLNDNKPVSGLYALIRSGLVHEYFMKGESTIFMHSATASCGILIDKNASPKLKFIVDRYYSDLIKAFQKYYDEIINGKAGHDKQEQLRTKFSKAVDSLPFNPFGYEAK